MLDPTTFIEDYNNTDKSIVLKSSVGQIIACLNVCNYLSSHVVDNKLQIVIKAEKALTLTFESNADAINGLLNLEGVVNGLYPNCALISYEITPPSAAVTLTKIEYVALMSSNALIPYTNYIVVDSGNSFGEGISKTFLLQAKNNNDSFVEAKSADSNDLYVLDFLNDKLFIKYSQSNNLVSVGNSKITANNSSVVLAENNSQLTLTNCSNIKATNNSSGVLSSCTNVTLSHCEVELTSCSNVELYDIGGSLTGLSDVVISPTSEGKLTKETLGLTDGETVYAYERGIYLTLPDNLTTTISKRLNDRVAPTIGGSKVNSRFLVTVPINGLNGFSVLVKDSVGNMLDTLTDSEAGQTFEYVYDPDTSLFIKSFRFSPTPGLATSYNTVTVTSYGQGSFINIFTYSPPNQLGIQVYINGLIQKLGVDFTVSGRTINYIGDYILEIGDIIQVYYS